MSILVLFYLVELLDCYLFIYVLVAIINLGTKAIKSSSRLTYLWALVKNSSIMTFFFFFSCNDFCKSKLDGIPPLKGYLCYNVIITFYLHQGYSKPRNIISDSSPSIFTLKSESMSHICHEEHKYYKTITMHKYEKDDTKPFGKL